MKHCFILFEIYGPIQNIYMAEDGWKMEFKWKVNANVSYLHSSYSSE